MRVKSLVPTVRPTVRQSIELITASKTMLSIGLTRGKSRV